MLNRILLILFLLPSFVSLLPAQNNTPKLIVGIVVDQMRYDYLYRYRDQYGKDGFNRLLRQGYSCENTHFNYVPTYTAPGHSAIYTGTTPSINGIISNEWWDPEWQRHRYVTTDTTVHTVGAEGARVGKHSPRVLLSSTITDELKLATNFRSKVVGICLKDRASILPAGHIPDGAYWFDDDSGNWITSSYYMDSLPNWVQEFNQRKLPAQYMSKPWNPMLPAAAYQASFKNWDQYKGSLGKNKTGSFPYDLPSIYQSTGNFNALRYTPFGNSLTLDFAIEAMDKMDLGKGDFTDFLCLSFSGTDYCAHNFGVHAEETEDTYLRLDADIERLLRYLDDTYGKDNVLVFLTADHGGAETPQHLEDIKVPAGVFPESKTDAVLDSLIGVVLGKKGKYIEEISNQQVWFNRKAVAISGAKLEMAERVAINYFKHQPGVYDAFTYQEAMQLPAEYPFISDVRRGLHPRRSGDVIFLLDPAWHADDKYFSKTGTTHGSPYAYDTHVPLLWYGWKIRPGENFNPILITDIAPTLAAMLRIMEPSGNTGKVITELLR